MSIDGKHQSIVSTGQPKAVLSVDHTMQLIVEQAVVAILDRVAAELLVVVRREIRTALTDRSASDLMDKDGWISPKQAASLVGVSYDTVLSWISEGKLAAHKAGRQFRIKRLDLEVFMSCPLAKQPREHDIDQEAARILRRGR